MNELLVEYVKEQIRKLHPDVNPDDTKCITDLLKYRPLPSDVSLLYVLIKLGGLDVDGSYAFKRALRQFNRNNLADCLTELQNLLDMITGPNEDTSVFKNSVNPVKSVTWFMSLCK